jgi:predicted esterase
MGKQCDFMMIARETAGGAAGCSRIQFVTILIAVLLLTTLASSSAFSDATPKNLRGWHTDGQTFLVWEHPDQGPPASRAYYIYSSSYPIYSVDDATVIGMVTSDNAINYRLHGFPPVHEPNWVLPDEFGGSHTMKDNEAFFVATPHQSRSQYYAVVSPEDDDVIPGQNSLIAPIDETTDPVMCHIQFQSDEVTVYAHWIDGRAGIDPGRPDYPIMGNEFSNGIGFNFAVWESEAGRPLDPLPVVIWLHGAGQSFVDTNISNLAPYLVPSGLFITFDDPLPIGFSSTSPVITFWWGYAEDFNRFHPASLPSDSATVINYTARRVQWTTQWLMENEQVDRDRISLAGYSMGGAGTLLHSQLRSDLFAAGIAYVPPLVLREAEGAHRFFSLFGSIEQELKTNIEGEPGIWDLLDQRWRTRQPHPDWPYALIVCGKNDVVAPWDSNAETYANLDSARTGYALYWDERSHSDWGNAQFQPSLHLSPEYLTRFRSNQSFPAFSKTDLYPQIAGRQPEPGNGDPLDGDPWGTWGGYLEWGTEDIVDTPVRWECTIWITSKSPYDCDIPESDAITASVTLRNLQSFASGLTGNELLNILYRWKLIDLSNGSTLQEGIVRSNEDGTFTIDGLLLSKDPYRLFITPEDWYNQSIHW